MILEIDVNSYKPVSILPGLLKILEKRINKRLLNYLTKFKILFKAEFNFRQGISTEDTLIDTWNGHNTNTFKQA